MDEKEKVTLNAPPTHAHTPIKKIKEKRLNHRNKIVRKQKVNRKTFQERMKNGTKEMVK